MQPLPELGRTLLVQLDPSLDRSRRVGLWCAIKSCPGVVSITDMAAISRETLDLLLLPDEYKILPRRKR